MSTLITESLSVNYGNVNLITNIHITLHIPVDKIKYVITDYRKLKCKIWECEPHN
jgi:hypothetical protein